MANLTLENIVSAPIEQGDAGIILKPDGTFKVFTTGHIDAANLTEAQKGQGEKLMVLAGVLVDDDLYAAALVAVSNHSADLIPEARH